MNSEQLRQFKAIAETGSLTKAAEQLYVTQPALSMSLSKLEDEIARPLFTRQGKSLKITESGLKLLEYANRVVDTLDEAQHYFNINNHNGTIRLYRIGGTAISLLTEGCYFLPDIRLESSIVKNEDIARVMSSGSADIVIADDRHVESVFNKYTKRAFLFHQMLLLSVPKGHPLSERDEISAEELPTIEIAGRNTPLGFNSWISEFKKENGIDFEESMLLNTVSYFTHRDQLPVPYLMGSFGIGVESGAEYFSKRKSIRVLGKYCERDICVYWSSRNSKKISPVIDTIRNNAAAINEKDQAMNYGFI